MQSIGNGRGPSPGHNGGPPLGPDDNAKRAEPELPELLTTAQAAAFLNVGESTLERDRLTPAPRFPFVRLTARIVRYHLGTLRAVVVARSVGTSDPGPQVAP